MDSLHDMTAIDLRKLQQALKSAPNDKALFQAIVNAPFEQRVQTTMMYLGIVVLLLVDRANKTINRIALSDTELGKSTLAVTTVPFHKIKIPFNAKDNIIVRSLQSIKPQDTTDWRYLFDPVLDAAAARFNQASAGIAYSAVYPLTAREGGAIIFSYFQYRQGIGKPQVEFMEQYSRLVNASLQAGS